MRVVFEYCPYASLFYFQKFGEDIRDLGDFCIGIFRIQITVWTKKPYYDKYYKKQMKEFENAHDILVIKEPND